LRGAAYSCPSPAVETSDLDFKEDTSSFPTETPTNSMSREEPVAGPSGIGRVECAQKRRRLNFTPDTGGIEPQHDEAQVSILSELLKAS